MARNQKERRDQNLENNRLDQHVETDRMNTNSEGEKQNARNAGRAASDNVNENLAPSRGEIKGTPGGTRASSTGRTGSGLKHKMGRSGTDLDGQLTDQ